jgi:hypothetical protein
MAIVAPLVLIALYTLVLSLTREAHHPLKTTLEGTWQAEGTVEESHGDEPVGTKVSRAWQFERRCEGDRCRLVFTRQGRDGTEVAPVTAHGSILSAEFRVRTPGCGTARTGVLTRHFEVLAEPEFGRLTARSVTDGSFPNCGVDGTDQQRRSTYRWIARKRS